MNNIINRVKRIVADQFALSESEVTPEKNFITDFGADSLDSVELAMALEDEFEIEIPEELAETIITVQSAIDLILKFPNRK